MKKKGCLFLSFLLLMGLAACSGGTNDLQYVKDMSLAQQEVW